MTESTVFSKLTPSILLEVSTLFGMSKMAVPYTTSNIFANFINMLSKTILSVFAESIFVMGFRNPIEKLLSGGFKCTFFNQSAHSAD